MGIVDWPHLLCSLPLKDDDSKDRVAASIVLDTLLRHCVVHWAFGFGFNFSGFLNLSFWPATRLATGRWRASVRIGLCALGLQQVQVNRCSIGFVTCDSPCVWSGFVSVHTYGIRTYMHAYIPARLPPLDRQTGRQADRQTGRQAGIQADRRTGGQADRHAHIHT